MDQDGQKLVLTRKMIELLATLYRYGLLRSAAEKPTPYSMASQSSRMPLIVSAEDSCAGRPTHSFTSQPVRGTVPIARDG